MIIWYFWWSCDCDCDLLSCFVIDLYWWWLWPRFNPFVMAFVNFLELFSNSLPMISCSFHFDELPCLWKQTKMSLLLSFSPQLLPPLSWPALVNHIYSWHSTLMIMKMKFDKIVLDDDLMILLATADDDDDHANHKKYHSLQVEAKWNQNPQHPKRGGSIAYRWSVKCF